MEGYLDFLRKNVSEPSQINKNQPYFKPCTVSLGNLSDAKKKKDLFMCLFLKGEENFQADLPSPLNAKKPQLKSHLKRGLGEDWKPEE